MPEYVHMCVCACVLWFTRKIMFIKVALWEFLGLEIPWTSLHAHAYIHLGLFILTRKAMHWRFVLERSKVYIAYKSIGIRFPIWSSTPSFFLFSFLGTIKLSFEPAMAQTKCWNHIHNMMLSFTKTLFCFLDSLILILVLHVCMFMVITLDLWWTCYGL